MHSVMQQPFKTAVLILVWGWLLFLVLAPNLLVVGASVMTRDPVSFLSLPLNLDAYRQLFDPLYLEVFLHSLYMAAMTTLVCLLIGYPFAWALSKVGKQRQLILIFLLIVPFWTNSLVRTYALKLLLATCMEQSHYYRQWWYWGGEAKLRTDGTKMKLTTIPDKEWAEVEKAARVFWDEVAQESETKARVVKILKEYNEKMEKAGRPYRYT